MSQLTFVGGSAMSFDKPGFLDLFGAFIVSIVSGFISISRRVVNGHDWSLMWVISEFLTAILCGYLMFTAYPQISDSLPKWFTLPIAVAFSAHVGGKVFQEVENELVKRYTSIFHSKD
jgi:hypothetical protein